MATHQADVLAEWPTAIKSFAPTNSDVTKKLNMLAYSWIAGVVCAMSEKGASP